MLYQVCEHGSWPTLRIYPGVTATAENTVTVSVLQLVHLEDWYPSLLDERVCLLGVGCVRAVFTLHHHDFSFSTPLHQLHAAL